MMIVVSAWIIIVSGTTYFRPPKIMHDKNIYLLNFAVVIASLCTVGTDILDIYYL